MAEAAQVQLVPYIPPPQITVDSDEKQGAVLIGIQTPYGGLGASIPPNNALDLARAIFKQAKELNKNATGKAVQGRDAATGAVLLSKPAPEPEAQPEDVELASGD
jgi:hypothetical protein